MKRVSLSLERSLYLWLLLVLGFSTLILLGVLAITGPAGLLMISTLWFIFPRVSMKGGFAHGWASSN